MIYLTFLFMSKLPFKIDTKLIYQWVIRKNHRHCTSRNKQQVQTNLNQFCILKVLLFLSPGPSGKVEDTEVPLTSVLHLHLVILV